jgi:hypothetical protein
MRRFLQEIKSLPGVVEAQGDMFGERSFQVGAREFMHIHGSSTLHILLPKDAKARALEQGRAHQHPFAPRSGMVELRLRSDGELGDALELARVAYDFLARNAKLAEGRRASHATEQ